MSEPKEKPSEATLKSRTRRIPSLLCPQIRAVQPEDSFAPVTPNPYGNFELLEYDHDSVPVLHSTVVQHASSTDLINCPPEELVFDALDAIEAGFKPRSKFGWPSAIEPLRRTASQDKPTRVLNDIDLYLHEKDNKLYVATDRGLLIFTEYLKLIGVNDDQPVRFEGRIPQWAKAALQAREKRKVVQIFGKIRKVKKTETLDKRKPKDAVKDSRKTDDVIRKTEQPHEVAEVDSLSRNVAEQGAGQLTWEEVDYDDVLEVANDGDLLLPLGATVIVYKIDDNDDWAYGRRCDNGAKGWFPISHTCPVDWSLDRFAGSSAAQLNKHLPVSRDPQERYWNGLTDFMRRQGGPEGPTWKETCAASAAAAAQLRIANLRSHAGPDLILESNAKIADERTKAPTGEPLSITVSSTETHLARRESSARSPEEETALVKKTSAISRNTAQEIVNQAEGDTMETETLIGPLQTKDADDDAIDIKHNLELVFAVFKAPSPASNVLGARQEPTRDAQGGVCTTFDSPKQVAECSDDAHQPQTPGTTEAAVVADAVTSPVLRDPFTVPRCDLFARNDDIEYDWGDDDGEEL